MTLSGKKLKTKGGQNVGVKTKCISIVEGKLKMGPKSRGPIVVVFVQSHSKEW